MFHLPFHFVRDDQELKTRCFFAQAVALSALRLLGSVEPAQPLAGQ
jgi:hypothetical protein